MSYRPEYSGSRLQGAYTELKRTMQAHTLAFGVPASQLSSRVRRRLRGEAKDAVDHLDVADLNDDEAMVCF